MRFLHDFSFDSIQVIDQLKLLLKDKSNFEINARICIGSVKVGQTDTIPF